MIQQTLQQMKTMKLSGMAYSLEQQLQNPAKYDALSFEERMSLMVQQESNDRHNRKLQRLIKAAKFKFQAHMDDIDFAAQRDLNRAQWASLAQLTWVAHHQNILLTGLTGIGKTFLACALGHQACIQGYSVRYFRTSRLLEQLTVSHGDGSYMRFLNQLAKTDILILDDWGLEPLSHSQRNDLLEVIDDRVNLHSTIITS